MTPEDVPLELFGRVVGEQMALLLGERGIAVVAGTYPVAFKDGLLRIAPGEPIESEAVVSLPCLEGRRIDGLPAGVDGFLPVDEHCRVFGVGDVYAAGDVTAFPVKQGGIAAREADVAAEAIAAAAGCEIDPAPFVQAPRLPEPDGRIVGRHLSSALAPMPAGKQRILAAR